MRFDSIAGHFHVGIGLFNIIYWDYTILKAFSPTFWFGFLIRNGNSGWVKLGGVVLCITGAALAGVQPRGCCAVSFCLHDVLVSAQPAGHLHNTRSNVPAVKVLFQNKLVSANMVFS